MSAGLASRSEVWSAEGRGLPDGSEVPDGSEDLVHREVRGLANRNDESG